jgi:quercetin dioxygenase-like cupin family protein
MHNLWYAHIRTHGTSDLFVQDNTWDPGGSTGWHTHPGASLIIVTQGTVTAYEGDDPSCTPHVYEVGDTFVDSGGSHVHLIRNETASTAKTIAVQLVPHGPMRRIDAAAPGNCKF